MTSNEQLNQLRKGVAIEVNTSMGWVREIIFSVYRLKKTGLIYVSSSKSGIEADAISDGYSCRQTRWFTENHANWRIAS